MSRHVTAGICTIAVRASIAPKITVTFTPQEWAEFVEAVKRGEFD